MDGLRTAQDSSTSLRPTSKVGDKRLGLTNVHCVHYCTNSRYITTKLIFYHLYYFPSSVKKQSRQTQSNHKPNAKKTKESKSEKTQKKIKEITGILIVSHPIIHSLYFPQYPFLLFHSLSTWIHQYTFSLLRRYPILLSSSF